VRELIVPKVTGLLVPPGDSNALAAAIVQMLDNPSSAVTMGCQARNRAHALYDAQVNVCDIARIYGKALGGAAAASE
jgi:glycosyltransferase involved in cell wall biosynthesis